MQLMNADQIVERLQLIPHPEGGYYRETWRSDVLMNGADENRASATAIYFLLKTRQKSAWHRVDATEIWFHHAGDPLMLSMASDLGGEATEAMLGPDIESGERPQLLVPAHYWQAAEPVSDGAHGYTLVSCVVSPGFEFSGFELAE